MEGVYVYLVMGTIEKDFGGTESYVANVYSNEPQAKITMEALNKNSGQKDFYINKEKVLDKAIFSNGVIQIIV